MSRLLTTLLLEKTGYDVARYISIERLIEDNKALYYTPSPQAPLDGMKIKTPKCLYPFYARNHPGGLPTARAAHPD